MPAGSLCAGTAACVVPVYISEVAPFASRGALAYLFQLAVTVGILAAQASCCYTAGQRQVEGFSWMARRQVCQVEGLPDRPLSRS